VGASGAIFGIMGAVIATLYLYRDRFQVRDKRIGVVLAVWAAYALALGAVSPMVDNAAHVGGLLGGTLLVAALRPRLSRRFAPVPATSRAAA
jgi:rhomboid protease GluP